jgi:hypothetical protein
MREQGPAGEAGNGSGEMSHGSAPEPREHSETREHAEPLAASAASGEEHRPIAHFEPSPPVEGSAGAQSGGKPYVVWSSAPTEAAPPDPAHDEGV